jgi:TetR/AcrR family transcriptional regulator, regulator of cefoperazone and chloramphenicol sensitivity
MRLISVEQAIMVDKRRTGTRERLIEAAGEVFSQCGFRAAQVRDICRRAGANVAAVNYHFGGKAKLYQALLHDATAEASRKYPPELDLPAAATPNQRLHAFIRALLLRILDTRKHAWYGLLMAHELADPTAALDEVVDRFFRPMFMDLLDILRPMLGAVDKRGLYYAGASIVGQCLFHHQNAYVFDRLYPGQTHRSADIERLADHITRFSLGGLKALASSDGYPDKKKAHKAYSGNARKE